METFIKPTTVAILLHHSLLSMGIASRLREQTDSANIQVIDVENDPSEIQGMIKAQLPEIIILDALDAGLGQKITIMNLFEWAPAAKIICLDLSSERVRVVSSQEMTVSRTSELMNILQNPTKID